MATAAPWPLDVGTQRPAVRLRVAGPADASRLAELYEASGSRLSVEELEDWLDKGGALLVERDQGPVLAAVRWRPHQDGWTVEKVATRPDERGNGYGRWLMTKLEALAIRGNVPSLDLELQEPELLGYYSRMGYKASPDAPLSLTKRVGGVWQRQVGP